MKFLLLNWQKQAAAACCSDRRAGDGANIIGFFFKGGYVEFSMRKLF
jgi:hypothetical protein